MNIYGNSESQTEVKKPLKTLTVRIKKISSIAPDTTEVTFDVDDEFTFSAGQYITITLPRLGGLSVQETFRDFSIVSAPEEHGIVTIAFRNSKSKFKKALLGSSLGKKVEMEGPKGLMTLPTDARQDVAFFTGGIGITPFISIIRHIKASKLPLRPKLLFFNTSRDSAPYVDELEKLGDFVDTSLEYGEVNAAAVVKHAKSCNDKTIWFLTGSRGMVLKGREILSGLGISEDKIMSEEFTGYER